MVAREKGIWLGCVRLATLYILVPAREESTASEATCPSPTAAGHPTSTSG
jgi:hypothetical protein